MNLCNYASIENKKYTAGNVDQQAGSTCLALSIPNTTIYMCVHLCV